MKKKLKRIEINEKIGPGRIRASRTGGASASVSPAKGITLNTKHGARVSKTYKGLTLGMQNFNSVIRGRWSSKDDKLNLNLSKSGFSVSAKNSLGTFNFKNPNRSSATFAGIQVRGKNAAWIAGIGLLIDIAAWLIKFGFIVAHRLILVLSWVAQMAFHTIMVIGAWVPYLIFDLPKQLRNK